jgi:hypothetical protein
MTQPFLALITPLTGGHPDNSLPSFGVPGRPDQGLPGGGQGGSPSHPIYHPGHPDHGLPSEPPKPDHGFNPAHPDQSLPEGGQPVQLPEVPVPPQLGQRALVGVYVPGRGWTWKAYPMDGNRPDQGLPPAPQPKKA